VDQRERWQALQSHLSTARARVDTGDLARALEAIDAALAIDPDFLAAHSLRDRILASQAARAEAAPAPTTPIAPVHVDNATAKPARAPSAVSSEGYAKFEARAKRRRVDRRIEAARLALEHRQLKDAADALDEIAELDPNLPELSELTTSFNQLRGSNAAATSHRGPWIAAAASFAVVVFGASWLQQTPPMISNQTAGVSMPVEPSHAASAARARVVEVAAEASAASAGTAGSSAVRGDAVPRRAETLPLAPRTSPSAIEAPRTTPAALRTDPRGVTVDARTTPPARAVTDAEPRPSNPEPRVMTVDAPRFANPDAARMPAAESVASSSLEPAVSPPPTAPVPPSVVAAFAPSPAPTAVPVSAPVASRIDSADEMGLVRQTLQRYRSAYDGLDARSAHAVYPSVNQAALARAFDGLESQTLTFDACDVQLRGEAAFATCRGTARYVPKVGSREPRVEPRVWNFTLRKAGNDWTIDTARAER